MCVRVSEREADRQAERQIETETEKKEVTRKTKNKQFRQGPARKVLCEDLKKLWIKSPKTS